MATKSLIGGTWFKQPLIIYTTCIYIYLAKTFLKQWFFRHKVAMLNILRLSLFYGGMRFYWKKSLLNVRNVYAQLMQD